MQNGFKTRCYPTPTQAQPLLCWIGCQRVIYNAKVNEDRYYRKFARKALALAGQYPPVDQEYSRFIGEDTLWLKEVPSQVLRNGAYKFKQAYARFFKKLGGRPTIRHRIGKQSVWLTKELFRFEKTEAGELQLIVGTKKHPIGMIDYKRHKDHTIPDSIHISIEAGKWFLSFSTDDGKPEYNDQEIADWLKTFSQEELAARTTGLDRGVIIPLATPSEDFDFLAIHKHRGRKRLKARKRFQRQIARRVKGSKRRERSKLNVARLCAKDGNVRREFAHQTSHKLAIDPKLLLFVFEDLKIKNMTKSAKGTAEKPGTNVRQKAGLNRSILGAAWGQTKTFLTYKAKRNHKLVIEVPAPTSSQQCSPCGHVHPDNRVSQSEFVCQGCGFSTNADRNAACVIGARGVDLIRSGEWKPKEKKSIRIRRSKVPTEMREPDLAKAKSYARVRTRQTKVTSSPAQRSLTRETPATAQSA